MEKRSNLLNSSQKTELTSDSSDFQETSIAKPSYNHQAEHNNKLDRKVVFKNSTSDEFQFEQVDFLQNEPENNTSLATISNLKNELDKYKKIVNEKQFTIREIKLELDEATSKNKELETELQALKIDRNGSNNTANNNNYNSMDNVNASTFSTFEELLKQNSDQISSLSEARLNLFNLLQKYQQCFDEAEGCYQNSQNILSELHNSILEIIPPDLQGELQKMQTQKDKQQPNANKTTKSRNNKKENKDEDKKNKQEEEINQILQIIHFLVEDRYCYSTTSRYSSTANSTSASVISVCNDDQILGHLENALYFIRTLSKSDYKENPIEDSDLKELIQDQCKKIENILKTNEPTKVSSIFGDIGSIDDQLKAFYNLTNNAAKQKSSKSKNSNQKNQNSTENSNLNNLGEEEEENLNEEDLLDITSLSPEVRSLFSLFTAAIEVNRILFDRNRILEREYKKHRKANKEMKTEREQLKNEINSTDKAISDIKKKIETNLGHDINSIESGLDEFCDILSKTSDIIDIKDNEAEKLKKSVLRLKKTNSSLSNQLKAKDKQISSLVKKLNEAKYEKETAEERLNKTIEKVEAEKANLKTVKEREIQHHQHHEEESQIDHNEIDEFLYNQKQEEEKLSLTQQLQEAQEQNRILQNQLTSITKEMDNYQASSDLSASITPSNSNYEAHISGLKGKLKTLRQQKARSESQLQSELDENKKRNEQIEKSYRNQISSLTKELDNVRSQFIELKEMNQDAKAKQENSYVLLAKAKVIQKKLETELNEAKENLKLLQQQNELKIKALKMSYEKVSNDSKQKISDITKKLSKAVNFNIENESDLSIDDLASLVNLVSEKYDFKVAKDAALAREKLNIGKRARLSYAVDELRLKMLELEKKVLVKENEKNNQQKKFEKKMKEYNSVTQSSAYKEATEWKKWAEKLYSKLYEGDVCPINVSETKAAIERTIEDFQRPASFDRKLNILRSEKKMLTVNDIRTVVEMKYKLPVTSIRPLILMLMFCRKIENYAYNYDSQITDSSFIDENEEEENE